MPNRVPTYKPPHGPVDRHREYDRLRRDEMTRAFYHSGRWKRLRRVKLSIQPYCEPCLRERDELTRATTVHHKVELKDDWGLRLDLDNLESLCASCHSRLHAKAASKSNSAIESDPGGGTHSSASI